MDRENRKKVIVLGIVILAALVLVATAIIIKVIINNKNAGSLALKPDNIAVTFGDDTRTQKNFTWYTDAETSATLVQYYPFDSAVSASAATAAATVSFDPSKAQTAEGFSERIDTYVPAEGQEYSASAQLTATFRIRHGVYIDGLAAGTTYVYRVGDGKNWSEPGTFATAPDTAVTSTDGFSFLVFCDTQGYVYSDYELWGSLYEAAARQCPNAAFAVHLGDFTEIQDNSLAWKYYFGLAPGLDSITTVPVAGNKDDKMFMKYFLLGTREGVTGLNGYYSFDYMNVHFSVLNTGDGSKDLAKAQVKWLKRDLAGNNAKNAAFRVVLIHKAPYSDRNHADDPEIVEIREQLLPVFEEYNVDVVLEGHDHYYFRSEPVTSNGLVKAAYETSTVSFAGETLTVYSPASSGGIGGVFYLMPGASGVKQHNKSFREMPEILAARSDLLNGPSFCICDVTAEHIYFRTYEMDRYRRTLTAVECWGIANN